MARINRRPLEFDVSLDPIQNPSLCLQRSDINFVSFKSSADNFHLIHNLRGDNRRSSERTMTSLSSRAMKTNKASLGSFPGRLQNVIPFVIQTHTGYSGLFLVAASVSNWEINIYIIITVIIMRKEKYQQKELKGVS